MIREKIIAMISQDCQSLNHYRYLLLKQSIITDMDRTELDLKLDLWFEGIIHSLFYRPNHNALIFEGPEGIGKSFFFNNLFPKGCGMNRGEYGHSSLYETLIINLDFQKSTLDLVNADNFHVEIGDCTQCIEYNGAIRYKDCVKIDKRLASFYNTVTKWPYPPRKNFFVIPVKGFDRFILNSIDRDLLWMEIFDKFKPSLTNV